MTDKVKQAAPTILKEIKKAKNILLHCHPSTDGDSIGSALGMMHVLKKMGKNATVISGDDRIPPYLQHLPGVREIVPKNYLEINANDFDLFLILDSGGKKQITNKGEVVFPKSMRTVVIDHHNNDGFGDIDLIDRSYPAVCQMIYDLCQEWQVEIPPESAGCLYVGIYTDTGFKYKPTTSATFEVCAQLVRLYPEFTELILTLENTNSRDRILITGLILSSIENFFGGRVAVGVVPYEKLIANSIDSGRSGGVGEIANMIKSVVDWDIGICFVEWTKNQVNVHFRGRSTKYDLGEIARHLGGGGHQAAAAARIDQPLEEAKNRLIQTIAEIYPELGTP